MLVEKCGNIEAGVKERFCDEHVSSLSCRSFETCQMQSTLSLDKQSIRECCLCLTLRCLRAKHLVLAQENSRPRPLPAKDFPTCDTVFDDTCHGLAEVWEVKR